jgi:hypothetical protein
MDKKYLVDSYDLVERFLCESLKQVGTLYAHPHFVPVGMGAAYTRITKISILGERPEGPIWTPA